MRMFWPTRPRRFEVGLVFVVSVALVVLAFRIGLSVWQQTPNIADFSQFVDPETSKVQGKAEYIFGFVLFGLFGILSFLDSIFPWNGQSYARAVGLTRGQLYGGLAFFLAIPILTSMQCARSVDATNRLDVGHAIAVQHALADDPQAVPMER